MEDLNNILKRFSSIELDEMGAVNLMSRIDLKYWFRVEYLPDILYELQKDYLVLEINGQRLMEYTTKYFDTSESEMYLLHHNSKPDRYKLRVRSYMTSGESFLEVKHKSNKRRTVKKRIRYEKGYHLFSGAHELFLQKQSRYLVENLNESLNNQFSRITLVRKDFQERCTIDLNLSFRNEQGEIGLPNLVVFELKKGRGVFQSPLLQVFKRMKVRQKGLSKYCTGRALLDPGMKQNRFKPQLLFLRKKIIT